MIQRGAICRLKEMHKISCRPVYRQIKIDIGLNDYSKPGYKLLEEPGRKV